MSDKYTLVQLNPLRSPALDGFAGAPCESTLEALFDALAMSGVPISLDSAIARWRELTDGSVPFVAPPAEPRILGKLVWPLHQAKASYALGNYLATIALCGMVAEMLAILIWEIADDQSKKNRDPARSGKRFEACRQDERANDLLRCGLTESADHQKFTDIRQTRSKYLHRWSEDHGSMRTDAANLFFAAQKLTAKVLEPTYRDGRAVINPRLYEYLSRNSTIDRLDVSEIPSE